MQLFKSDVCNFSKIKVNKSDLLISHLSSSSLSSAGLNSNNKTQLMLNKIEDSVNDLSQKSKFKRLNERLHRLFPSIPVNEFVLESKIYIF